jgi:hypothetical protein
VKQKLGSPQSRLEISHLLILKRCFWAWTKGSQASARQIDGQFDCQLTAGKQLQTFLLCGTVRMSNTDISIAAAALAIALIAFVTALGQLVQQYFATADGHRRYQRSVMGGWATKTRLRWRWREFRFETLYTTPEIFMAGGNMPAMDYFAYNGMIWSKREDFVLITGSHRSLSQTSVLPEQTGPNVHKLAIRLSAGYHSYTRCTTWLLHILKSTTVDVPL